MLLTEEGSSPPNHSGTQDHGLPAVFHSLFLRLLESSQSQPAQSRKRAWFKGVWEIMWVLSETNGIPTVGNLVIWMPMFNCKKSWLMWSSHALGKQRKCIWWMATSKGNSEKFLLASIIMLYTPERINLFKYQKKCRITILLRWLSLGFTKWILHF